MWGTFGSLCCSQREALANLGQNPLPALGRTEPERGAGVARLRPSSHPAEVLIIFLGRPLDVLDHAPELFPELLVAVIDSVHVGASPRNTLDDPASLFDVLIAHPVQRKLRRVEGHSVGAMDS
jgi:hypothetical protein